MTDLKLNALVLSSVRSGTGRKEFTYLIKEFFICDTEDVNHHLYALQVLFTWLECPRVQVLHDQLEDCIRYMVNFHHCLIALTLLHASLEHSLILLTKH